MKNKTFKTIFLATIPVMAGYLVLGLAFGILLASKGYSFFIAFLMSLLIYAGSMQFVAINLITSGATMLSTILVTLMVNARHIFYGISMLMKYKDIKKAKPYLIFALTDETFALVCQDVPENIDKNTYYLGVSFLNQCYWISGSVLGALVGSAINFNTKGIDFAMTALFVIIFTDQIITSKNYLSSIIGLSSSLLCLLLFGASNFLIPSMILITCLLLLTKRLENKK